MGTSNPKVAIRSSNIATSKSIACVLCIFGGLGFSSLSVFPLARFGNVGLTSEGHCWLKGKSSKLEVPPDISLLKGVGKAWVGS